MLFLVNLRPLPKIPAWGGVVNAIYSKFTTPPQNQSLGRGRKSLFGIITPVTCPQSRDHQIYDPSPRVPFSIVNYKS